jgi:hypothetical protein
MAKKKEGDLRLLKDGVVFGPTDRAGLDRLLSAGRLTSEDQVSVRNADWISIADFLAVPTMSPTPATSPGPAPTIEAVSPPADARKKTGDLRVINSGRVTGALTRADVQQLLANGRLGEDDLVCALDGPWMRVGDFLSTLAAARRPSATAARTLPEQPEGGSPSAGPSEPSDRSADPNANQPLVVMAGRVEIVQSKATPPLTLTEPMSVVGQSARSPDTAATYRVDSTGRKKAKVEDQWYVRIRAMCSAPLGKHHLKALYQSREITSETLARHPKWDDNDWRPISSIPELADLAHRWS